MAFLGVWWTLNARSTLEHRDPSWTMLLDAQGCSQGALLVIQGQQEWWLALLYPRTRYVSVWEWAGSLGQRAWRGS